LDQDEPIKFRLEKYNRGFEEVIKGLGHLFLHSRGLQFFLSILHTLQLKDRFPWEFIFAVTSNRYYRLLPWISNQVKWDWSSGYWPHLQ